LETALGLIDTFIVRIPKEIYEKRRDEVLAMILFDCKPFHELLFQNQSYLAITLTSQPEVYGGVFGLPRGNIKPIVKRIREVNQTRGEKLYYANTLVEKLQNGFKGVARYDDVIDKWSFAKLNLYFSH